MIIGHCVSELAIIELYVSKQTISSCASESVTSKTKMFVGLLDSESSFSMTETGGPVADITKSDFSIDKSSECELVPKTVRPAAALKSSPSHPRRLSQLPPQSPKYASPPHSQPPPQPSAPQPEPPSPPPPE